jgi:hypothetical protein
VSRAALLLLRRLREISAELDDAQLRLLELRTGIPLTPRSRREAEVADLEAAFALHSSGATTTMQGGLWPRHPGGRAGGSPKPPDS